MSRESLLEVQFDKDENNKLNNCQYIPVFISQLPKHLSSNIIKDILQIIVKNPAGRLVGWWVVNYPV